MLIAILYERLERKKEARRTRRMKKMMKIIVKENDLRRMEMKKISRRLEEALASNSNSSTQGDCLFF